jgi:hypothetical protein
MEIFQMADNGKNKAVIWQAIAVETNEYLPHCILLGDKFKSHKGGGIKFCISAGASDEVEWTNDEESILNVKIWIHVMMSA